MQSTVLFNYVQAIIPPRCRKARPTRFPGGVINLEIREVSADQAPVAIIAAGTKGFDNPIPFTIEYRWWEGTLWTAMPVSNAEPVKPTGTQDTQHWPQWPELLDFRPQDQVQEYDLGIYACYSSDKSEIETALKQAAAGYVLIDGIPHRPAGEPRYVVMTFGRNHGGTAVMIDDRYNSNISHNRYFNLAQLDDAIALATSIATERGDTKNLPMVPNGPQFEILLPQALQVTPSTQHGEGDPFLNTLDALTIKSGGAPAVGLVAGLMAVASTSS